MAKKEYKEMEITDPAEIVSDLLKPAKEVKSEFTKETQQFTKTQMDELIDSVSKYYNVPNHVAFLGIVATLQRGGTSRNKKSNVKVRFGQTNFESKTINAYITKVNKNFTPRQFARYFANEIFDIARSHDLVGNCYVYISRNSPDILKGEKDEEYWSSDFQVDNPACPAHIRNALSARYNAKFRGTTIKEVKKSSNEQK